MGPIAEFLKSIQFVTGLISLFAFVAVVFLGLYYRSVHDKKGLEYVFKLFQAKTDRATFYDLASLAIERTFWFFLVFLVLAFVTYVMPFFIPPRDSSALPAEYQERFARALVRA